ncbi:AAA family ATPase [Orrella sp. 11846]|uniref:AAA family ATPase n=1 Tax=Orrella sp. 11846 TaxID=3409913 RepID=UPI003B59A738
MATKPKTFKRAALTNRHEPLDVGAAKTYAPVRYGQGRGGRPWRRLRLQILERDNYLCQCSDCKTRKIPLPAHEVDHISNELDASGKLNDAPTNLRAINRDCHKALTAQQRRLASRGSTMTPAWLPVTAKPLTLVCGPPGAGKTMWVTEHAKKDDLVIDLDVFAVSVIGKPLWEASKRERAQVIRARNDLLADYMRGKTGHQRCYLIDTAGSFKRRKFWSDRNAEVVIVDTEKEICKQRIRQCKERPKETHAGRIAAVDRWK